MLNVYCKTLTLNNFSVIIIPIIGINTNLYILITPVLLAIFFLEN
jgi:hypothetical protein